MNQIHRPPASTIQHGGDHYTKMTIQPFRFSLANKYDGASHSILKYVSRHGDKGGAEDLRKAEHIAFIRAEELTRFPESLTFAATVIEPLIYCGANKIEGLAAEIIHLNHKWAICADTVFDIPRFHALTAEIIAEKIAELRQQIYGKGT